MIKTILSALVLSSAFAAPAFAIEPIPGSITHNGLSRSTLSVTPIGSVHLHQFYHGGSEYREVYRVGTDRRFELVSREQADDN